MNRKLIYSALFSTLFAIPMCFTSCGDDDDDDNNGNPNGNGTPNTQVVDEYQNKVVPIQNGTLMGGKFSVSETKQVYFSKANLLKTGTTYSFAEDQTLHIGAANITGPTKDLMNWFKVDGLQIENSTWRCPTRAEWKYLVTGRPNASSLCMYAKVTKNNVSIKGTVLFPDGYTLPKDNQYKLGVSSSEISTFTTNDLSEQIWHRFEVDGAVFLPFAGSCSGYTADSWYMYENTDAHYWSADALGSYSSVSYPAHFGDKFNCDYQAGTDMFFYCYRLVKDAE